MDNRSPIDKGNTIMIAKDTVRLSFQMFEIGAYALPLMVPQGQELIVMMNRNLIEELRQRESTDED